MRSKVYESQERLLRGQIDRLNAELGLVDHPITFGYIGNFPIGATAGGPNDDRLWMVFLPHPGRVGKTEDRIGGWKTGSLDGIRTARCAVNAFAQGARFARNLTTNGGLN